MGFVQWDSVDVGGVFELQSMIVDDERRCFMGEFVAITCQAYSYVTRQNAIAREFFGILQRKIQS